MKWLFTTDWHINDRRPGSRIDPDFFETQIAKVEEILQIAKDEKVDVIYHGGDLFDRPLMDLHIVNTIIQLLKKSPVPIEIVLGNHDLLGYNIESVSKTALGTLLRSGVIRETQLPHINVTNTHTKNLYNIAGPLIITHNMVSPDEVIFDHVLCEDIAPMCPGATVLCGHYHRPFEYTSKRYGTTFINPGSLMRSSIAEVSHQPYVILGREGKVVKKRPLKSAKLGASVFDVILKASSKKREKSFDSFIDNLKDAKGNSEENDLKTLIYEMAKEIKAHDDVRNEAVRRVEESTNTVGSK